MRHGAFVYSGDPVPPITEQEHPDFYLEVKKAILAALRAGKLLTEPEYLRCAEALEKSEKLKMLKILENFAKNENSKKQEI